MTSKKAFSLILSLSVVIYVFFVKTQYDILEAQVSDNYSTQELTITFNDSVKDKLAEDIRKELKKQLQDSLTFIEKKELKELTKLNAMSVKVPSAQSSLYISAFKKSPLVKTVEPNYLAQALSMPDDQRLNEQWGMTTISAVGNTTETAWDKTHGNPNIKVAIVDTGIQQDHPDLTGKVVLEKNFSTSPSVVDANGHGTHVAGAVAAKTNNGVGVAGAGFDTSLINAKALADNGSGYYDQIASAIVWSVDNGAMVVNLSLGGTASSTVLQNAVNYAQSKGVVLVAAAGNSGSTTPYYPANYPYVVSVAATDQADKRASMSNYGSWVDVAAPGVGILSTYKSSGYATMTGTSMASAYVSGIAALVASKQNCSGQCIIDTVQQTSDPIAIGVVKYGRINAYKAASSDLLSLPTSTPIPTTTPTQVSPTPTPTPTIFLSVSPTTLPSPTATPTKAKPTITVTKIDVSPYASGVIIKVTISPGGFSRTTVLAELTSPSGKKTALNASSFMSTINFFQPQLLEKGTYTFVVQNVTKSGYAYSPSVTTKDFVIH